MTATGEILAVHMEAIEAALDALAADTDIPADDYIEALDSIAHRCQSAAHAHRLETSRDREWAEFVVEVETMLSDWKGAISVKTDRALTNRVLELHVKLGRWEERLTSPTDKAKRKALDDRVLRDVFGFDTDKIKDKTS